MVHTRALFIESCACVCSASSDVAGTETASFADWLFSSEELGQAVMDGLTWVEWLQESPEGRKLISPPLGNCLFLGVLSPSSKHVCGDSFLVRGTYSHSHTHAQACT